MQSYDRFLELLAVSDLAGMEINVVQLVEFDDCFILLSYDNDDQVYLVNRFYKDVLDFDNTHCWESKYSDALNAYINLIQSEAGK